MNSPMHIARSDAKSDKKWLPRLGFLFRCSAIVATVRKGKENAAFQVAALLTRLSDKKVKAAHSKVLIYSW
jgi:hypothetical protein